MFLMKYFSFLATNAIMIRPFPGSMTTIVKETIYFNIIIQFINSNYL